MSVAVLFLREVVVQDKIDLNLDKHKEMAEEDAILKVLLQAAQETFFSSDKDKDQPSYAISAYSYAATASSFSLSANYSSSSSKEEEGKPKWHTTLEQLKSAVVDGKKSLSLSLRQHEKYLHELISDLPSNIATLQLIWYPSETASQNFHFDETNFWLFGLFKRIRESFPSSQLFGVVHDAASSSTGSYLTHWSKVFFAPVISVSELTVDFILANVLYRNSVWYGNVSISRELYDGNSTLPSVIFGVSLIRNNEEDIPTEIDTKKLPFIGMRKLPTFVSYGLEFSSICFTHDLPIHMLSRRLFKLNFFENVHNPHPINSWLSSLIQFESDIQFSTMTIVARFVEYTTFSLTPWENYICWPNQSFLPNNTDEPEHHHHYPPLLAIFGHRDDRGNITYLALEVVHPSMLSNVYLPWIHQIGLLHNYDNGNEYDSILTSAQDIVSSTMNKETQVERRQLPQQLGASHKDAASMIQVCEALLNMLSDSSSTQDADTQQPFFFSMDGTNNFFDMKTIGGTNIFVNGLSRDIVFGISWRDLQQRHEMFSKLRLKIRDHGVEYSNKNIILDDRVEEKLQQLVSTHVLDDFGSCISSSHQEHEPLLLKVRSPEPIDPAQEEKLYELSKKKLWKAVQSEVSKQNITKLHPLYSSVVRVFYDYCKILLRVRFDPTQRISSEFVREIVKSKVSFLTELVSEANSMNLKT